MVSSKNKIEVKKHKKLKYFFLMTALQKATEIIDLYVKKGKQKNNDFPYISIIEHSLKTAKLASQRGYNDDIVIACLLLDIKHLIREDISIYFEKVGINDNIKKIITNMLRAKRYMVTINNEFCRSSSNLSLLNMKYQGGIMNWDEAFDFEEDINYKTYIIVCKLHNESANSKIKTQNIFYYLDMIEKSIAQNIKN
jgi:predicted HD phosphohydrolase